ncbi:MAG: NAD(P)-dependent glycerol-3-phosphate dehydrogenase [SAR202 cluster bacterium]|nr:NAD(P)-dependent glycerol-3-phosphate dehydrogenase [SAR202 cluster bacterium]
MARIGIVGATSWGTTLGIVAARNGSEVRLLARSKDEADGLQASRENPRFLPGAMFPDSMRVESSPSEALAGADVVIIAVPSRTMRDNVRAIRECLEENAVLLSASKGLEISSGKRMSQVLAEELPKSLHGRICALSGPNLAGEIIQGKPSSTVVASKNLEAARAAQAALTSNRFRVYTNTDIVGVELGGALKNIIALGAGICDGLDVGDNAKAAFMTRGLAEIARLGVAAGAEAITMAGLAGMGDLIATCSSPLSRNHYVGVELAKGRTLKEIRNSMKNIAEGVDTTAAAVEMAARLRVDLPIARVTYRVLFEDLPIGQAIAELMGRPPSPEWSGIEAEGR